MSDRHRPPGTGDPDALAEGVADRDDARVDLVAAALCDAGFFPEAWDFTGHTERAVYRRETHKLLTKLDARAAAARPAHLVADLGGVPDTQDGWNATWPSGDDEKPRGWPR